MKPTQDRIQEEIEFYREVDNVADLPAIYSLWSNGILLPRIQALGFATLDAIWIDTLAAAARHKNRTLMLVSLGTGNCENEVRIAQGLIAAGVQNFTIECLEISPHMIKRGSELIAGQGLSDRVKITSADLNTWQPERPYDACFANHSLHHIVELEHVFASVQQAIEPDGLFLVNDMIGRNGHMRWPEALVITELIWATLPARYRYNHQLKRLDDQFQNWDCSTVGFEGIRAQDILPLLVKNFSFDVFLGYSNLLTVFIDRSFGHNFDPKHPYDVDLLKRISDLDDMLIDLGVLKPTQMLGVLRPLRMGVPQRTKCFRHWTPEFSVRDPAHRPALSSLTLPPLIVVPESSAEAPQSMPRSPTPSC